MDNKMTSEINKTAEEKASEEAIRAVEAMKAAMTKTDSQSAMPKEEKAEVVSETVEKPEKEETPVTKTAAEPAGDMAETKEISGTETAETGDEIESAAEPEPAVDVVRTEPVQSDAQTRAEEEAARALSASQEAIRAVEAMKAAQTQTHTDEEVYIAPGVEWRRVIKTLEEEVEKELGKANAVVNDVIAREKAKCSQAVSKEFADKETRMVNDHKEEVRQLEEEYDEKITTMDEAHKTEVENLISSHKEEVEKLVNDNKTEVDKLNADHEAELEKMKNLYAQQLDEVQEAFREKTSGFRKEIDHYKEQIEILMLHIDDPFVLQEIQMKQKQETE